MPYEILILAEDEKLRQALNVEFSSTMVKLAREAFDRVKTRRPDLLVIDIDSIPDLHGPTFLEVLREFEAGKDLPVIALGSPKSQESVLEAFELGIEDYLAKPFDFRELVARVHTVLRRRLERAAHWGTALSLHGVDIDPSQRRCLVNGKRVILRPREFELLEILMRKAGRVLSRPYLLETVWGMSSQADTRAVDVMVYRVRARLGRRAGRLIETMSKMGYCFRPA